MSYDKRMRRAWIAAAVIAAAIACGGQPPTLGEVAPTPRKMTVWLDGQGLDAGTAGRMRDVGVDMVVVRRGSIDLRNRAPVLRIDPPVEVTGPIPVATALTVSGTRSGLDREDARALWQVLDPELGGSPPAELILDLPMLEDGFDVFLVALREESGVAVVPMLSFDQLASAAGRATAVAAGSCIVPAFGTEESGLRGIGELAPLPLNDKLAPLAETDVRVRIGIALQARTIPEVVPPLEGLGPLTEPGVAKVSTSSSLDRTFTFERPTTWSGRNWAVGESLAIRWMDPSRLRAAMQESHRLVMPELGGWDLVSLPGVDQQLGLSRESLLRFLGGEGPGPLVQVGVSRQGRRLRVTLDNPSVFATAVSNHGNWIEVSFEEGWVKAEDVGNFDRLERGTSRGGRWQRDSYESVNAVRFLEVYVAPGERLVSGRVELPSSRSTARVRWNLTLFDGSAVTGETSG